PPLPAKAPRRRPPSPPAAPVPAIHPRPRAPRAVPPTPPAGGPTLPPCSTDVMIAFLPAARVTDKALCPPAPPDVIIKGSMTVMINNLPAARMGDQTAHGGVIVKGEPTVMIGG